MATLAVQQKSQTIRFRTAAEMLETFGMQTGGKEYLQGDIVKVAGDFKFSVKVLGTMPIRQIDIVKSNKFVHNVAPLEKDVAFTYVDAKPSSGESYYYVRVVQVDDQMAWSSPIWITR